MRRVLRALAALAVRGAENLLVPDSQATVRTESKV